MKNYECRMKNEEREMEISFHPAFLHLEFLIFHF